MLFNKLTIALVAGLAAVGEAEHHARRVHRIRSIIHSESPAPLPTITRTIVPTPAESDSDATSSASSSSVVASSGPASSSATPSRTPSRTPSSIPYSYPPSVSTGIPSQGAGESGDITLTYTVSSGTSISVITTTIHRTTTDVHTVTAVSTSSMIQDWPISS